ncbi:hypothetical protein WJX74_000751 [Apatococcus lobatus]|uniref:Large ribosomal subunit protein eL14 domain-containing protein n=1 Tax=Apatococcus lobatus TaxID=904363 RepID=A0AAW1RYY9_9CHLO
MPFTRFVEIGRVAMVNYGPEHGKLVVISDVVDQNRAVIDRPDEIRRVVPFKRLILTDFKCELTRLAKKKELSAALEESGAFEKFAKSAWGQKIAKRKAKANLSDFERYQAMKKKQARSKEISKAVESMS